MSWLWAVALAAAPVHFEAGPGCADAAVFEGLVAQADWNVALTPEGAGWRFELSRGGERALVRSLPAAASCQALAGAVAVIVERYFREVAAGRVVAPPPKPAPPRPAPKTTQEGSSGAPTAAETGTAPPSDARNGKASAQTATPLPGDARSSPEPAHSATTSPSDARNGKAASAQPATAPPGDARSSPEPAHSATTSPSDARSGKAGSAQTATPPPGDARSDSPEPTQNATTSQTDAHSGSPAPAETATTRGSDARNGSPAPTQTSTTQSSDAPNGAPATAPTATLRSTGSRGAAREPAASASPPPGDTSPAPAPAEQRESAAPPAASATVEPAPRPALFRDIELSAGAGGVAQTFSVGPPDFETWFAAHLAAHLGSRFRAGLLAGFGTTTARALGVAGHEHDTVSGTPFAIVAEGGACTLTRVELCGSAVVGVRGSYGVVSATDTLYKKTDAWLVRPDVGLLARARYRLPFGLFIAAEAWAAFPLGGGAFVVQGITSASVPLPVVDITGSLQLGWSWQIL
jgi:hypothetical protein